MSKTSNTMNFIANVIGAIIVIILLLVVVYFMWGCERKVNFSYGYKDMVRETVREMVKPEALKENK
jgi:hypothetical protein